MTSNAASTSKSETDGIMLLIVCFISDRPTDCWPVTRSLGGMPAVSQACAMFETTALPHDGSLLNGSCSALAKVRYLVLIRGSL
eukprot:CAMPEP_0172695870 /NCGR_PEP_ID=MMETSP1074-20121228/27653_1 /TAXON_ID=2916 /ORGANISM="Ceratium fusus, Strain PA161109" /LENGTH=83 /DNA_ID=CAMNT_0013516537 /DNA_START=443 /DNA_END=694 /DNA_ORIENTATION=-